MAKKAARDKQQGLPGIVNKPTEAIKKKAQEYADALYERMTLQEQENVLRDQLVELMEKREIDKRRKTDVLDKTPRPRSGPCPNSALRCTLVELDGYEVKLSVVPESRKIKVKKIGGEEE